MSKSSDVNIPSDYTIAVGGTGTSLHIDTDLDNIHIKEIAPIKTDATSSSTATVGLNLHVDPLDIKVEPLDITIEPLKADIDTNSVVDVKPLAIDSCTTLKLAPLPPMCLEQPYHQHFGFTMMGVELFGFTMSGQSNMHLFSPARPKYQGVQPAHEHESGPGHEPSKAKPATRSGLRVRLGD